MCRSSVFNEIKKISNFNCSSKNTLNKPANLPKIINIFVSNRKLNFMESSKEILRRCISHFGPLGTNKCLPCEQRTPPTTPNRATLTVREAEEPEHWIEKQGWTDESSKRWKAVQMLVPLVNHHLPWKTSRGPFSHGRIIKQWNRKTIQGHAFLTRGWETWQCHTDRENEACLIQFPGADQPTAKSGRMLKSGSVSQAKISTREYHLQRVTLWCNNHSKMKQHSLLHSVIINSG